MTGLPSPDRAREAARAGICPICQAGPWRAVAKHVAAKHGIGHRELKSMLGIPVSHGLNAPDVEEAQREQRRTMGAPPTLIRAGRASSRGNHLPADDAQAVREAGPGLDGKAAGLVRARTVSAARRRKIPLDALPSIRERVAAGERLRDIAEGFGCTASAVHHALRTQP